MEFHQLFKQHYLGYRVKFIYDDGSNWPFRFKVDLAEDKARYKVSELESNVLADILDFSPEGLRKAELVGADDAVTFAMEDLDEDRFGPNDAGQEGQDLVISSLDPMCVHLWAQYWLEELPSLSEADKQQICARHSILFLVPPVRDTNRIFEEMHDDLKKLVKQAECATQHEVRLRVHASW
jgi:hypothetical protein